MDTMSIEVHPVVKFCLPLRPNNTIKLHPSRPYQHVEPTQYEALHCSCTVTTISMQQSMAIGNYSTVLKTSEVPTKLC